MKLYDIVIVIGASFSIEGGFFQTLPTLLHFIPNDYV